jgi:hypothetical protein
VKIEAFYDGTAENVAKVLTFEVELVNESSSLSGRRERVLKWSLKNEDSQVQRTIKMRNFDNNKRASDKKQEISSFFR